MSLSKKIILLVEDEEDTTLFIKDRLELEGYQVLTASDGLAGLEIGEQQPVDLVITDVMMPGMNGYQFCREFKKREKTSHIPVLMLTAKTGQGDKYWGEECGCTDYITKPFEMEELLGKISNCLKR